MVLRERDLLVQLAAFSKKKIIKKTLLAFRNTWTLSQSPGQATFETFSRTGIYYYPFFKSLVYEVGFFLMITLCMASRSRYQSTIVSLALCSHWLSGLDLPSIRDPVTPALQ